MSSNTVKVTIEADDKGVKKAFEDISESAGKSAAEMKTGFLAAGAAAAAFLATMKSFVNEAAEAEAIENRLTFAVEAHGYSYKQAKSALDDFAESIHEMTRFSDDEARDAISQLMIYTRDLGKAQEGTRLAMGMSVRTGLDLASALRYVGMGMTGNVEILGRVLPQFKDLNKVLGENATEQQKAEYFWKIFRELFGAAAASDVGTYARAMKDLTKEWGELKEEVGSFLLGPAKGALEWIKDFVRESRRGVSEIKVRFGGGTEADKLKVQIEDLKKTREALIKIYEEAPPDLSELNTGATSEFQLPVGHLSPETKKATLQQILEIEEKIAALQSKMAVEAPINKADTLEMGKRRLSDIERLLIKTQTLDDEEDNMAAALASQVILEKQKVDELDRGKAILDMIMKTTPIITEEDTEAAKQAARQREDEERTLEILRQELPIVKELERELQRPQDEDMAAAAQGAREGLVRQLEDQKKAAKDFSNYWDSITADMGQSVLMNFFNTMNKGFKDLEGMVKNIGTDILSMIEKMIANALLFGNIMGQKNSYGEYGGLVGLLSPIFAGLGVGAGGSSAPKTSPVIAPALPADAGKTGRLIYNDYSVKINSVNTLDADSFEQKFGPSVNKVVDARERLQTQGRRR